MPNLGAAGAPRRLWYATERGARAALDAGLLEDDAEAARRRGGGRAAAGAHARRQRRRDLLPAQPPASAATSSGRWPGATRSSTGSAHGRAGGARSFADAVLTYVRLDGSEVVVEQRFLELDRATLSVDRLAAELARYGRLLSATEAKEGEPLWRSQYPSFPPVVCVLAGAARAALARRRDTASRSSCSDPAFADSPDLSVRLCLAEDLAEHGPFAPIFTDVRDPEKPVDWLARRGRGRADGEREATGRAQTGQLRAKGQARPGASGCSKATAWRCWATLEPESVDAIVTDPPYGIGFQHERWDSAAIREAAARAGTSGSARTRRSRSGVASGQPSAGG